MNVVNGTGCIWINELDRRYNIKTLDRDKLCDWLIEGAGIKKIIRRDSPL